MFREFTSTHFVTHRFRVFFLGLTAVTSAVIALIPLGTAAQKAETVKIVKKGVEVEVTIGGRLFTRYTMLCAPNKPVFYPILTDTGKSFTRRWPVEPDAAPGESHDHVHHRGLWFTHSSVNGIDFWSEEGKNIGKTVTTRISDVHSGNKTGSFTANTEWRSPDGKLMATDRREIKVTPLPTGDTLLDFNITIKPAAGSLLFGDNKDGVFGLRLPDSLAVNPTVKPKVTGTGHILTSTGAKDADAWGKRADWVDYWGPIEGETYGVAIFDSPQNFRHPQTWHARDYGLFTVNPFGLHDFNLGPKGAGDLTVPGGDALHAEYCVYFHRGDAEQADVAGQYKKFSTNALAGLEKRTQ